MDEEIEDLHAVFIEADWIKARKVFDAGIPSFVALEKNDRMAIPQAFCTCTFPPSTIPINTFLSWKIPRQSSEIIATKATEWFSEDEPSTDVSVLQTRGILSKDFIEDLESVAGQAWLNGSKLIIDQRYNNGTDRLPLWAVIFWNKVATLQELQVIWRRGTSWLQNKAIKSKDLSFRDTITKAQTLLDTLPWNFPMPFCQGAVQTFLLSSFLGITWLTDEHIDIMMEELDSKVDVAGKVQIATLSFSNKIRKLDPKAKSSNALPKKGLLS